MTQTFVVFAIAGLSLVVFIRALPRVRRLIIDPSTRWLSLAMLVLIIGGMLGDSQFLTEVRAFKLVYTALFLIFVLASLSSPAAHNRSEIAVMPLWFITALWAWLFGVNALQNASSGTGDLLLRLIPGTLWIALLLVWKRAPITREMLATTSAFALTIPGLMLPFIASAWRPCDEFKCGVFNSLLIGAYSSENYISQQVAIIVALHLVAFGLMRSIPLLALASLWLLAAESRTAQYALLAGLIAALLISLKRKILKPPSGRKGLGFGGRSVVVLLPLAFVLLAAWLAITASPQDFSNRGSIWIRTTLFVREEPFIGLGVDRWAQLQATGLLPEHFPHSLYLFVAFSGGLIGILLLFLWLSSSMLTSAKQTGHASASLVLGIVFMTLGLLEVVWNPVAIDGTSWMPLMLMAVRSSSQPAVSAATRDEIAMREE